MRTGRTMAVLAAVAAVIVTGTACGGSATAPAAPSSGSSGSSVAVGDDYAATGFTKDPCSLLTDAEVTAALGGKATAQPDTSASGLKVCNWSKSATSGAADLQLHYNSAPLAQAFKVGLDKNMLGDGEQRVDIGQGAVLKTGKGDVIVLLGGSTFEVSAKSSKPLPDDVMVSLARAAAGRVG